MGTSSTFGGQLGNTPLVPKWLVDPEEDNQESEEKETENPNDQIDKEQDNININKNDLPSQDINIPDTISVSVNLSDLGVSNNKIILKRFQSSRSGFNKYLKTGNSKRVSQALRSYVRKGTKGSKNATNKMGKAPQSVAKLASVLNHFIHNGIQETLKSLKFDSLIGKPFIEVLIGIFDYICPNTGNIPDSIVSDAYSETIIKAIDLNIDTVNKESLETILNIFISETIEKRILNDIGNKLLSFSSIESLEESKSDVFGYIQGLVSDCIHEKMILSKNVSEKEINIMIKDIYEASFEIMKDWEDT